MEFSPQDLAVLENWPEVLAGCSNASAKLCARAPDFELAAACETWAGLRLDCAAALELGTRLWQVLEVTESPASRLAVVAVIKRLIESSPELRVVGEDLGVSGRPWVLAASRMHFPECAATVSPGEGGQGEVERVCVSGPSSPLRVTVWVYSGPDSRFVAAELSNFTSTDYNEVELFIVGFRLLLGDLPGYGRKTTRVRFPLDYIFKTISCRCDFIPKTLTPKKHTIRCLKINI